MSDQGDAKRWRPVSNESGAEPDDPTGPMPAVKDEPGFPPVDEEQAAWSTEATGGFPAPPTPQERAPFEPADPIAAEEQSFSALRRSLAERLARYTEPEGGWPDPSPTDPTPPFGTSNTEESAFAETDAAHESAFAEGSTAEESSYGSAFAEQDRAEEPARDSAIAEGTMGEESSYFSAFAERDVAEEAPYGSAFAEGSTAEEPSYGGSVFAERGAAEETSYGTAFTERGAARETSHGSVFAERSAVEETPLADGSADGDAGRTVNESSHGFAERTVQKRAYGLAGRSVQDRFSPSADTTAEEQDAENDFFGSDEKSPDWDNIVVPAGPPPQPGKPSSGNLRLPEWMKDGGKAPPSESEHEHEEERRSRLPLYAGIGVLVLGLLAAGGVYLLKGGDAAPPPVDRATSPTAPVTAPVRAPRDKVLARFHGLHTKAAGRIIDQRAGLSYPRLQNPWVVAPGKSSMSEIGFSASQFAVTEDAGGRPTRWGRLMSGELAGAERSAYDGPGTERAAALEAADLFEARMYAFTHRKRLLASQPLNVGGHKGWLVGYYLTYHRPGVRATAETFTVAVVNTGRATPGVLCMTVPNTDRRLLPDINFVMRTLKVL